MKTMAKLRKTEGTCLEFLTATEVANMVNLAAQTVKQAADEGVLRTAGRTARGIRLFAVEDVRAWRATVRQSADRRRDIGGAR